MVELQYRTYDELLSAVISDWQEYDLEGMIEPQSLIKVAQKINKELSAKINSPRQEILYVEKGRVRLPLDFYQAVYATICANRVCEYEHPQGLQTEDVVGECLLDSCGNTPCGVQTTVCGNALTVKHFTNSAIYKTTLYKPLRLESSSFVHPTCPNQRYRCEATGYIKDGWLYTNIEEAHVYFFYLGDMVDEEGNLLVLDHPIVNEYYEYALKKRILENMLVKREDVANLYKLIDHERKNARLEARNYVFTPDFKELKDIWLKNREYQYNKYYKLFQTRDYYV